MENVNRRPAAAGVLGTLMLAACASGVPPEIKQPPVDEPTLAEVLGNTAQHHSRQVRWGGKILETENHADSTQVTVLALPLTKGGEPQSGDRSPGRFIANIPAFLEPTVYTKDRRLTVTGTITGSETRAVGEYPYTYPVVQAEAYYLWPLEPKSPPLYPGPWWYDPWYYPWGPRYAPYWY